MGAPMARDSSQRDSSSPSSTSTSRGLARSRQARRACRRLGRRPRRRTPTRVVIDGRRRRRERPERAARPIERGRASRCRRGGSSCLHEHGRREAVTALADTGPAAARRADLAGVARAGTGDLLVMAAVAAELFESPGVGARRRRVDRRALAASARATARRSSSSTSCCAASTSLRQPRRWPRERARARPPAYGPRHDPPRCRWRRSCSTIASPRMLAREFDEPRSVAGHLRQET